MFVAVLAIGVLNLALGFMLAIALERPLSLRWVRVRHATRQHPTSDSRSEFVAETRPSPDDSACEAARPSPASQVEDANPAAETEQDSGSAEALARSTDVVRDPVHEMLPSTIEGGNQGEDVETESLFDPATQTLNPLGLAKLVEEWLQNDPLRVRLVCGVFIDVDRFAAINERLGEQRGDAILASLGLLLQSLIRKERGLDRIARVSGQRYLLFFGDTALRNAMNGAERIRSIVQATTFKVGDEAVQLTVSCGVSEWTSQQSQHEWLEAAQRALSDAKKAGPNCTCADESNGPRIIATNNATIAHREVVVNVD